MTDRLFQITYALMSGETVTCSQLAERFECSVRTIMRDIEKLSLAGVPVYMNRGKGGGVGILGDYVIDKDVFSEDEKKQILVSMQALNETGFGSEKETLEKLKGLFGKNETDWLEIEFSRWGCPGKIEKYFEELKKAVLSSSEVKIKYAATGKAPSLRVVQPVKLCYRSNSWYLYGYCLLRNDFRFFKISRIIDLKTTDKKFTKPKVGRVLNEIYEQAGKKIKVKVKIKKEAVYRAVEELPVIRHYSDGSVLCEFEADDLNGIVNYILSYGCNALIKGPDEIKKLILAAVEKMHENYFGSRE